MLTIWGRLSSVNVCKVVWAARELGLAFERIDVGGPFGGLDTPDFLARNPNGRIPVIDDDGFVLWESNAIVRYLAARHGDGGLWPRDPQARASSDRWMDWQSATFNPALRAAFHGLIRTPPGQRDAEAIAASVAESNQLALRLEAAMGDAPYLVGDTLTIGDIALGSQVDRWLGLPVERPDTPRLLRWYRRLCERPATRGLLGETLV